MIALWTKFKVGLGIAGAVIVAIGIAFLKGRRAGIGHIEAEQAKRRLESVKQRKEIDDEISQLGSNDIDQRYAQWLRDDDPR